jgi:hypothetical protein
MWHEVIRRGLHGLTHCDDKNDKWGQAHVIGNYVIMRVIYEAEGVFTIELTQKDDKENFILAFNKEKIKTEGHEAIKNLLQKLQILKYTRDYYTAQEWFGNEWPFSLQSFSENLNFTG